jgi:hypothetical protein
LKSCAEAEDLTEKVHFKRRKRELRFKMKSKNLENKEEKPDVSASSRRLQLKD